ncbi:MAG TPA: hypothetical protein VF240_22480 [Pyrinomonadaceae bacterium]
MDIRKHIGETTSGLTQSGGRRSLLALACLLILGAGAITATALSCASTQQPEEVRTVLTPTGFEPPEATRTAGRIRLRVTNQSGAGELTLRLTLVDGGLVGEARVPSGAAEWVGEFELSAGKYVLTEASNPAWLFYVIVQ